MYAIVVYLKVNIENKTMCMYNDSRSLDLII
jgi:hypothetical protein